MSSAYPFEKVVASFVTAAALASCAHATTPSRSETPGNRVPTPRAPIAAFENLPRFQRLWTREGLGRYNGVVHDGVYYTIANDGRSAQAVDVTSGKTLWQSPLPTPNTDDEWVPTRFVVRARFVDGGVIFVYDLDDAKKHDPLDRPTRAVVVRLSASDGRVSWSNVVECSNAESRSSASRFYVVCNERPFRALAVVRELDPKTGAELARVALSGPSADRRRFGFSASGEICGLSDDSVWCGRIAPSGLQILWRERTSASQGYGLQVAGEYVIEHAAGQVVVRHVADGRLAWKRAQVYGLSLHENAGTALRLDENGGTFVVRLSDGAPIAKIPINESWGGGTLLFDGNLTLIDVPGPVAPLFVLDSKARVQPIARNVIFFDDVSRGVLLSRNVGSAFARRERRRVNLAVAPLEAYSLTEFAPPHNRLGPYDKVVSVLEFFPFLENARGALAALRPIPGFSESLEKIIASGSAQLKSQAIAVAGLTRDARFLPLLRRELDRAEPAEGAEEWAPIVDAVDALIGIDSPDAVTVLFDFWRRIGPKLSPPGRRSILRDAVAGAVWRYGARRQWVSCPDIVFASSHADPDRALIGTDSPGVEYAVDDRRQWAAICEARKDDDGNGRLEVLTMHDGDTAGDELETYLVIGSGAGTPVDNFVAADPTGRWIVVTKSMCVYLVDVRNGRASALNGADGRPGDTVFEPHRAASFSADGNELLYIRSDGSRAAVIQRNLPSGRERRIDPGAGELSHVFFDRSGRFVVMDMSVRDTDGNGVLRAPMLATPQRDRRCRAPTKSWSDYVQFVRPVQRITAVNGGRVEDRPKNRLLEPAELASPKYELISRARAVRSTRQPIRRSPLPFGPFHWQPRR